MATTSIGNVLQRAGQEIPVAREEAVFTVSVPGPEQLAEIERYPNVERTRPLVGSFARVELDEADPHRDDLMAELRDRTDVPVVCHHAYQPVGAPNTRYYLTDRVIARFEPSITDGDVAEILAEEGLAYLGELPNLPGAFLLGVTDASGRNPLKVANSLAARYGVEYAEPDLINRQQRWAVPSDPLFSQQWHLEAWSGLFLEPDAGVGAPAAWDVTTGERSVVVAVLDDGFDTTHPDFQGAAKIVDPADFAGGDVVPLPGPADYHGTPVAGVAVAESNGQLTVGVAPGCALQPIRFPIGATTDAQFVVLFDRVRDADVITCSWGPPPVFAPLHSAVSQTLTDIATTGAGGAGAVIVFAAGNDNAPVRDPASAPRRWRTAGGIFQAVGPVENGWATHPHTVAVAASTSLNRKAAYSNWGAEISVAAPSNNFHPLQWTWMEGRGIVTTDNEAIGSDFEPGRRWTDRFGGTSSACPVVAGVAALVRSVDPGLPAAEVRALLESTADKITDPEPDLEGRQLGAYDANGHSPWFGFGKVNAAAAVAAAAANLPGDDQPAPQPDGDEPIWTDEVSGDLAGAGDEDVYQITFAGRLDVALDEPPGADFGLVVGRGAVPPAEPARAVEGVTIEAATQETWLLVVTAITGSGPYTVRLELR